VFMGLQLLMGPSSLHWILVGIIAVTVGQNRSSETEICPSVTLSITGTNLGLNPSLRGLKPGTDGLRYVISA
jgi:hypothetical protein